MIYVNIKNFADTYWNNSKFKKTVSELSQQKSQKNLSLVEDDYQLYDFDEICRYYCNLSNSSSKEPASADALLITKKYLEVIEFKSGFARRITRENLTRSEVYKCPHLKDICKDYWDKFFEVREKEKDELKNNLKLKAVESYIFLEKQIFCNKNCESLSKPIQLKLKIVIDVDPVTIEEEMLSSTKDKNFETLRKALRDSLKRFLIQKDINNQGYYYDSIDVKSSLEFKSELNRLKTNPCL